VLTHLRVDTNYAFMSDTTPRFPYPDDLLPKIAATPADNTISTLAEACKVEPLTLAIHDLYNLNRLIIDEATARVIWVDGVFEWNYIVPVLHKLLLVRHEELDPASAALRAGSNLYIAAIRRRMGVRFLTHVQIRRLRLTLTALFQSGNGPAYEDFAVMLWLLVLGSTLSSLKEDHDWFISQATHHIFTVGASWDEMKSSISNVMWIDDLLVTELESLRQEVTEKMQSSFRHELL
jgi:hypothetical protein